MHTVAVIYALGCLLVAVSASVDSGSGGTPNKATTTVVDDETGRHILLNMVLKLIRLSN